MANLPYGVMYVGAGRTTSRLKSGGRCRERGGAARGPQGPGPLAGYPCRRRSEQARRDARALTSRAHRPVFNSRSDKPLPQRKPRCSRGVCATMGCTGNYASARRNLIRSSRRASKCEIQAGKARPAACDHRSGTEAASAPGAGTVRAGLGTRPRPAAGRTAGDPQP